MDFLNNEAISFDSAYDFSFAVNPSCLKPLSHKSRCPREKGHLAMKAMDHLIANRQPMRFQRIQSIRNISN